MPLEPGRRTIVTQSIYPHVGELIQNPVRQRPNQQNSGVDNPIVTENNVPVSPEIYRANFVVNNQPQSPVNLHSERANGNDEAMQEVYEIDRVAFADTDPYENYEDFINLVNQNNLSTYVVKDDDSILGYYQLEPIKDGDLYIDSMGLKPEYRMTRKGANAIKFSWEQIQDYARENNVQTMSLHVDASNRALVRMYERLGFTITETLNNYYENGAPAYFMEKTLEPAQDVAETEPQAEEVDDIENSLEYEEIPAEPTEETQVENSENVQVQEQLSEEEIEALREQQAEELENQKKEALKEELRNLGVEEERVQGFIKACHTKVGSSNEYISDDLFTCCKYLLGIEKDFSNNENVFPSYNNKIFSAYNIEQITSHLSEKDENGNLVVRTDVLPYLRRLASNNVSVQNMIDVLETSKENNHLNKEVLDFAWDISATIKRNELKNCVSVCKLKKGNEKVFDRELGSFLSKEIRTTVEKDDICTLIDTAKKEDENGNETFDKELYKKIKYMVDNYKSLPYEKVLFFSAWHAGRVKKAGCDMETFLKHGHKTEKSDLYYKIPKELKMEDRDKFKYDVFKACCYKYETYTQSGKETKTGFDDSVLELIKELVTANPPIFDDIMQIPVLIEACKIPDDGYFKKYKFSREIFDKAMELKQAGVHKHSIPALINSCKLSTYDPYSGELKETTFKNDIFERIFSDLKQDGVENANRYKNALICSIDTINGKETFIPERYEQFKNYNISIERRYGYYPSVLDFYRETNSYFSKKADKQFDLRLYKKYAELKHTSLETICNSEYDKDKKEITHTPSEEIIDAAKILEEKNITFTTRPEDSGSYKDIYPENLILQACKNDFGYEHKQFNKEAFDAALELLDKGYDGRDVLDVIYSCKPYVKTKYYEHSQVFEPNHYELVKTLLEQGIDIVNAAKISGKCVNNKGETNQKTLDKCLELYNLGIKNPCMALSIANNDDIAYKRLKECGTRGLPFELIENCKENKEFKDRLFKMATNLQDKDYSPNTINSLMKVCHVKSKVNTSEDNFSYEMFNHITDMETLGINKDNMAEILEACKYNKQVFLPESYAKVSELYHRGIDDKGIATFLTKCVENKEFSQEKYDKYSALTSKINVLRDHAHSDAYIIEKLIGNKSYIDEVSKTFGQDVMNNVLTSRIDGYITFVSQCHKLKEKTSEAFISDLNAKLDKLPSPELKVKRLRVLGSLADKIDENGLIQLKNLIKSPEMTPEQEKLANTIFADKENYKSYEEQVNAFMAQLHVPAKSQFTVRDYLMKEQLDKKVDFPKPIEEQMAQMDKFAQQMLTNPKISLDKKLKYIDEFRAKKADMQNNPEKYTTPKIFAKPMQNLKNFIMAYVNIPNEDAKFNNSITSTMYANFGIDADEDLINAIHYDAKFFDKLFSAKPECKTNFKRLIELKRSDLTKPLTQLRMELPEEGSELYEIFSQNDLIEQIKANQDTKRQFKEQNLDFDKWNSFDPQFKSETFTVEADPATEYKNSRFSLINIFQDEHFAKINSQETGKMMQKMQSLGYTIFNNNLYKNGSSIADNDLENFAKSVQNYIDNDEYFKSAIGKGNKQLTEEEKEGVTAFMDHLKNIIIHLEEIKGAKTVNDICLRLSDSNDIGRNIFFGNHVGCCNSVDSSFAGYSAPMHLLNAYNRGIELVDKFGNSYGNSNCFFALIDGKVTFVIDSFEANGKLASNPIVTDELIKFGKKVCSEMGRPDAQVMIGPNFNHIDKSRLKEIPVETIKVLGTVSNKTYCDSVGGPAFENLNNEVKNRRMNIYQ